MAENTCRIWCSVVWHRRTAGNNTGRGLQNRLWAIHSFSSLSYDRSNASSKASSPHVAIQSFLLQMRVSSPSLRSSNSFVRLLPCLPVTSIPPCIFPSITRCRRQFLRKMWPIQFAFRLRISCRIFLLKHANGRQTGLVTFWVLGTLICKGVTSERRRRSVWISTQYTYTPFLHSPNILLTPLQISSKKKNYS
jgi:hypothetical protein